MKTYILLNQNFESLCCGSDVLFFIDSRLNKYNRREKAKEYLERISKFKPWMKTEATHFALFNNCRYENGKYIYKNPEKL